MPSWHSSMRLSNHFCSPHIHLNFFNIYFNSLVLSQIYIVSNPNIVLFFSNYLNFRRIWFHSNTLEVARAFHNASFLHTVQSSFQLPELSVHCYSSVEDTSTLNLSLSTTILIGHHSQMYKLINKFKLVSTYNSITLRVPIFFKNKNRALVQIYFKHSSMHIIQKAFIKHPFSVVLFFHT